MANLIIRRLSAAERRSLQQHESTIEQKLNSFLDVGHALKAICDGELYLESHSSFEKYLADRWDLKRSRAYQLMDAAEVAADLKCHDRDISPRVEEINSEWQLRALKDVASEDLPKVIDRAAELSKGARLTAKVLKQAAQELHPQPSVETENDAGTSGNCDVGTSALPSDTQAGSQPELPPEQLSDEPAVRARAALPEIFKKLRYYFGNLGLGGQIEAEITSLMRKAKL